MKGYIRPDGYTEICMREIKNGISVKKNSQLHILIAKTYLPNPNNLSIVDHVNGKKDHNYLDNLEWVSNPESIKRAWKLNLIKPSTRRVALHDANTGKLIKEYESIKEASIDTEIPHYKIGKICKGTQLNSGKYTWSYCDDKYTDDLPDDLEDWVSIKGFPRYKISKDGKVYSKIRKIILNSSCKGGYECVGLYDKNGKRYQKRINRLVAEAYKEKPKIDKPLISNHLNGKKRDNTDKNLEWTTYKGNSQHAVDTGLIKPKGTKVIQYDSKGNELGRYDSFKEASKATGAHPDTISLVCRGRRKSSGGFKWKFQNIED